MLRSEALELALKTMTTPNVSRHIVAVSSSVYSSGFSRAFAFDFFFAARRGRSPVRSDPASPLIGSASTSSRNALPRSS